MIRETIKTSYKYDDNHDVVEKIVTKDTEITKDTTCDNYNEYDFDDEIIDLFDDDEEFDNDDEFFDDDDDDEEGEEEIKKEKPENSDGKFVVKEVHTINLTAVLAGILAGV